jgi:hypothetical protein
MLCIDVELVFGVDVCVYGVMHREGDLHTHHHCHGRREHPRCFQCWYASEKRGEGGGQGRAEGRVVVVVMVVFE